MLSNCCITKAWLSLWLAGWLLIANPSWADQQALPNLTDPLSATIAPSQEYALGQAWLRQLRQQTPLVTDPLINDYIETLGYHLLSHSDIKDKRLSLVVINSSAINAFAVPGGIIGINTGLLLSAHNESELASVIAHELAHLSQRHFARDLARNQRNRIPTLAAMLASIALVAATGSNAGIAALATTQGTVLSQQLRFSREREMEADRIGMSILYKSQFDPKAVASLFERMAQLNRYHQPPEFLLTHPLNASRINDAHNRARQYPEVNKPINLNFQLMKARTLVLTSRDLTATKQQLVSQLKQTTGIKRQATEYGLVLVDSKNRAYQQAQKRLTRLRKTKPYNTPYLVAQADIYNATDKANLARQLLATNLELVPDNYPLQLAYGQTLLVKHNKADTQQAVTLFKSLAKQRPLDPLVWQQLARAEGQNGNLLGTYLAQAEYKFLTNDIKQALQQLGYALGQSKQNFPQQQRINQRITEIKAAQKLRF